MVVRKLWKEKEKPRIRAVKIDNIRGLLDTRRMDRVPNAWIRELCGVTRGVDEKIDESVLRWFGHVESVLEVAQWVDQGRDGLKP